MTSAQALKTAGQQASVLGLPESTWTAFRAVIEAIPAGFIVHVNGIRDALDDAGIPASARGGLFAGAVKAGLLVPVVSPEGFEIRVKSTGTSARRATCRLYMRTAS